MSLLRSKMPRSLPSSFSQTSMSLTGCMVGGLGGDGGVILLLVLSELDGFPVSLLPESTVSASDWAGSSLGSAESPPLPDVALELPGLPLGPH